MRDMGPNVDNIYTVEVGSLHQLGHYTRVSPLSLNEFFFLFTVFFNINSLSFDPPNQVSAKHTENYLEFIQTKRL